MSEHRQNIAKAIAYDLENGPAHGARVATSPYLDNYHVDGHVNLLALADAVLAVTPAQEPCAWRVRYVGRHWMYFERKEIAEIYAQGDDNAEPLYAGARTPAGCSPPAMDAGAICKYLRDRMEDESMGSLAIACRALADYLRVMAQDDWGPVTRLAYSQIHEAQHDMIQQLHAELESLKLGIAAVSFAMGWTDICGKTNEEFARDLRRERDEAVAAVEKLTATIKRIDAINDHPGHFNVEIDEVCRPFTSTVGQPK